MASTTPRFQRMVISLVFSVVYIYNTEYTVRINLDDGANGWGFGQILSMATALPFMASIIELAFRLGGRDELVKYAHDVGREAKVWWLEALSSIDPAPYGWEFGIQRSGGELRRGYLGTRRAVGDWIRDMIFQYKHQKLVHTWEHICNAFPCLKRK